LPGKDVVYRFLNHPRFAWRQFLQSLSFKIVQHFESLISASQIRIIIIDDSILRLTAARKQNCWHGSMTIRQHAL
jgi:hypothetical protein